MPQAAPPQQPPQNLAPMQVLQHAQDILGDAQLQLQKVAAAGDAFAQAVASDITQATDDLIVLASTLQAQALQIQQLSGQLAQCQAQLKQPAGVAPAQPMKPGTYIKAPVALVGMLAAAGAGGVAGWFAKGAQIKRRVEAHEAAERKRLEEARAAGELGAAGEGGEEEEEAAE